MSIVFTVNELDIRTRSSEERVNLYISARKGFILLFVYEVLFNKSISKMRGKTAFIFLAWI